MPKKPPVKSVAAEKNRQKVKRRQRELSAAVAEIGEIRPVADPARRESCRLDLGLFLSTYFPNSTGLSRFSQDHLRVIARMQRAILHGGRFVQAVYRGFSKTTMAQNAALWATLYGHRRYVVIFGAEKQAAADNIAAIKSELAENDLLDADFHEVTAAVRALEGKPQRCASQTHDGKLTHIGWRGDRVILPRIPGAPGSGAIIACRGITGSGTRGLNHRTPEGTAQRPDFAILDDLQTDRSAISPHQVNGLLNTIKRSVLKLGGHKSQLACVVNATIIAPDDAVEQLMDSRRNPSWQAERIKMVRQFADAHETLWLGDYARLRNTFDRHDPDDQLRARQEATEFYVANRAAMDAGCEVSWESCFDPDCEVSAIQHAYNFLIDDGPDVFAAECQNEPLRPAEEDEFRVTAPEIATRTNGFAQYAFPHSVAHLTAFIDVQDALLFYVVCAWEAEFTGFVVDYGAFPDQSRRYFRLADAHQTLARAYPGDAQESQWRRGLEALAARLMDWQWQRADGVMMRLSSIGIDANYGASSDVVKRFCHTSAFPVIPTHGRSVRAGDSPMAMWPRKPGETHGHNWVVRPDAKSRGLRHVVYDVHAWKTFLHHRLRLRSPSPGSLSLWGSDPAAHEMFADQLASEKPVKTEGRGRVVVEWILPPNKPDNHFLDCCVGCCVLASMLGVTLPEHRATSGRKDFSAQVAKLSRNRTSLAALREMASRPTPQQLRDRER